VVYFLKGCKEENEVDSLLRLLRFEVLAVDLLFNTSSDVAAGPASIRVDEEEINNHAVTK
jgi:hypothetical protein